MEKNTQRNLWCFYLVEHDGYSFSQAKEEIETKKYDKILHTQNGKKETHNSFFWRLSE